GIVGRDRGGKVELPHGVRMVAGLERRLARLHGARELRLDAIEERAQALERLAVAGPRLLVVAAEVRAIALLVDGDHVLVGLAAPALDRAQAQALERRQQLAQHFRSEEHTSELQSREKLVCRLLLEKKKQ